MYIVERHCIVVITNVRQKRPDFPVHKKNELLRELKIVVAPVMNGNTGQERIKKTLVLVTLTEIRKPKFSALLQIVYIIWQQKPV